MRSPEEAYAYLTEMKQVLQYIGVSDCDMEKGQLRCDANVSVRQRGAAKFGTKAEVKNLNSFRYLKMALEYEIERQVELIESGGKVVQETRLYNVEQGKTVGMRSKEHAHDYRYFPEPDLVPLRVSEHWLNEVKHKLPELPADRRDTVCERIRASRIRCAGAHAHARDGRLFRGSGEGQRRWTGHGELGRGRSDGSAQGGRQNHRRFACQAAQMGELVALINKGELSGKLAKEILPKMFETGDRRR